jgi:AraC family transcriptional regulator, regulatory protein of adaptative response / DNA-3-methyladenine glycosylase II
MGEAVPVHEDFERCYRAVQGRDKRFDGRFVTAVRTTGIYCRPSCPAQTPKQQNVTFFPHAAAAAAAGYRACKRCRPDAAPGSREWDVRADLAARALRGIESGVIDEDGVPGLARRLAVSERHLHRVLVAEIGVGPLALARTRRAQTARMLIEHTELSLSTIAFSAGFASIRQFNDVMRAEFGCPPSELRRARLPRGESVGALTLRLQHRSPYAAEPLLGWLAGRAIAGVEECEPGVYRRVIGSGVVELRPVPEAGHVIARIDLDDLTGVAGLVARCRRVLDLDADPVAVDALLGADPALAPSVRKRAGLRSPGSVDGFEMTMRTIVGQQISVRGARTVLGRIVAAHGRVAFDGEPWRLFPTADEVAALDPESLPMPKARARSVLATAAAFAAGSIRLDPGVERVDVRAALLALPGIGPWSADYLLMRAAGDPDVLLTTDLGVRRSADDLGLDLTGGGPEWAPWRSYATYHLWAHMYSDSWKAMP